MGSTTSPPVSLAPFAFDWVGGDIHGLQALSIKLSSYVPAITDVTTALDRRAGQLTGDGPGGWQGSAASAFTAAWGRDALAASAWARNSCTAPIPTRYDEKQRTRHRRRAGSHSSPQQPPASPPRHHQPS